MRSFLPAWLVALSLPLVACGGRLDIPSDGPDDAGGDGAIADGATDTGIGDAAPDVATCAVEDCGPAPGAPSELCWDGSIGGFTGRCIRLASGTCGWELRDCPAPKPCTTNGDCGGAAFFCKKESCAGTGTCAAKGDADCPAVWAPVCGCDGKTYGNRCEADAAGMAVAHEGECKPTSTSCGGASGATCPAGQFCKYADGACLSAGPVPPTGTCTTMPSGCPDVWSPVCGCDGKTYGNSCDAAAVGQNVATTGTCEAPPPPPSKTCGGFLGATCASTEYCDYPLSEMCGAADGTGTCKPRPTSCTKEWKPVCGCDGETYANACVANRAGQGIYALGACK